MKLKEFKELLNQYPDDAIIQVAEGYTRGYDSGTKIVGFDEDRHLDFLDFRDNQFIKKGNPIFGKMFLTIGSTDGY